MENRFSVNRVNSEGIDNPGLELQENNTGNKDTVGELVNTTSSTCLYENPGRRRRSLVQLTREALPRLENYRNSKRALKRPSLGELHGGEDCIKVGIAKLKKLVSLNRQTSKQTIMNSFYAFYCCFVYKSI